jgi:hypothetical protein
MTDPGKPTGKANAKAPDHPTVPTVGRSWLIKIYLGLSLVVLTVFFLAGILGWEVQSGERDRAPGSARQSPGGYRSYHFWHSGYHGGK